LTIRIDKSQIAIILALYRNIPLIMLFRGAP